MNGFAHTMFSKYLIIGYYIMSIVRTMQNDNYKINNNNNNSNSNDNKKSMVMIIN
jgi:hypothetical protein